MPPTDPDRVHPPVDVAPARSQALIRTDRGARYVKQLASHLGHKLTTSVGDDGVGIIEFPAGRCVLTPADEHIDARAQAVDAATLAVIEDVVARHLARFGAKDELVVRWRRQ